MEVNSKHDIWSTHLPHAFATNSALAKLALCPPLPKKGEARCLTSKTHLPQKKYHCLPMFIHHSLLTYLQIIVLQPFAHALHLHILRKHDINYIFVKIINIL